MRLYRLCKYRATTYALLSFLLHSILTRIACNACKRYTEALCRNRRFKWNWNSYIETTDVPYITGRMPKHRSSVSRLWILQTPSQRLLQNQDVGICMRSSVKRFVLRELRRCNYIVRMDNIRIISVAEQSQTSRSVKREQQTKCHVRTLKWFIVFHLNFIWMYGSVLKSPERAIQRAGCIDI